MRSSLTRSLTLFRLVTINIIAVGSLRNLSITAQAGWVTVSFYIFAGILFLIPCILVISQMATRCSKNGGIYLWTKEAFGARVGFIILWLQWIYNLVWFPSICGFFAGVISYVIAPWLGANPNELIMSPCYMISMSFFMFWLATIVNLFGIKTSSAFSSIGAVLGTIIPMLLIIGLALFWMISGNPILKPTSWLEFIPRASTFESWGLFLTVMFSLFGLEMSAVHAGNVKNPKKTFPKALFISGIIIFLFLILSNIAIFAINDHTEVKIDIVTGLMASFDYFFINFGIPWMSDVIAITLLIGAFTTVSAWIMGLSRAFTVAAEDGLISKALAKTNQYGAPSKILVLQGVIFSAFCLSYVFMPSVNSAYWFLSALTAQLAVFAYLGLFSAALKLKYHSLKNGHFISNGMSKSTIVAVCLGFIGCIIAIIVGFIPTLDVSISIFHFDLLLLIGIVIVLLIPFYMTRNYKENSSIHNS